MPRVELLYVVQHKDCVSAMGAHVDKRTGAQIGATVLNWLKEACSVCMDDILRMQEELDQVTQGPFSTMDEAFKAGQNHESK